MCGIVGIYNYKGDSTIDRDELVAIRDRMAKRGPDGYGAWYSPDNRVGLGHRRLAIIDLSENGSQPMANADASLVIIFNGEIYNYKELRSALEQTGCRFRSTSDTEVLLHLYSQKGQDMVHDLRGMFAFAIWDVKKKGLFLARDPFGIKPLYYSDDGRTFRAASQVKALLAGGKVDTTPDPAGHVGFFLWGHVPEPYTLYKGIRSVPAGTTLWVDQNGGKTFTTFFDVSRELAKASREPASARPEEVREILRNALLDSVRHHLIADVPVGVFLSSGLDSTTLLALATECKVTNLQCVTLGFREYQGTVNDEVPLAEQVARHYGVEHRTIWVEKKDFHDDLPNILDAMDQPTTDGINSYFVSKAAREAGLKVVLSGLGGDELFGSYPSFLQVPLMVKMLGPVAAIPGLGKGFRTISAPVIRKFASPKYAGLLEYGGTYGGAYMLRRCMFMPWELSSLLEGEMVQAGWNELQTLFRLNTTVEGIGNDHLQVSALEMVWYMRNQLLRDTDWASMAHSVEIRVPLVDRELLRVILPTFMSLHSPTKRDMALTPAKALPDAVIRREKTGFSVPVRQWIVEGEHLEGERSLRGWAVKVYGEMRP
jgi:asparagine synthase (glutamine-hydrolysing)